ncbi:Serine--tRNA ligase, mitochondrial [Acarospora aff. strigata]|nr:Serine--tRNA ligase, mitochondrial [Acarospora aff. strigata]
MASKPTYTCISCRLRSLPKPLHRRALTTATSGLTQESPRPSIAPKPTIDLKHIRQNPELYSQNCIIRKYNDLSGSPFKVVKLFEEWQALQRSARSIRERNNKLRTKLTHNKSFSGQEEEGRVATSAQEREYVLEEARQLKTQISDIDRQEDSLHSEMEILAAQLPNITSAGTPVGDVPKVLGYISDHPEPTSSASDSVWRSHAHIGSELELMDFAAAATTSGWGWYYLTNEAALLELALVQFALSVAMSRGWKIVSPPSMVYSHIAAACGFRPRDQNGEQQIYAIQQAEKDREKGKPELSLAGTAEIPLAGMKANQLLEEEELPLKVVGVSRCYRAEAGSRGLDTKGLYRVHEFTKVEMFAWTMPDEPDSGISHSNHAFEEMVGIQKEILGALGLHCRILEMPSTDLGASATRKQDIEAYFPSRREKADGWGEVTSASICTDYQARRLGTRVKTEKFGRKTEWPHTVNGTAMAVPRVLAALLENGWDEKEMCVKIPAALQPWMGGVDVIRKQR